MFHVKVANRFIPDNLDMLVLDRSGPGFISAIVVSHFQSWARDNTAATLLEI